MIAHSPMVVDAIRSALVSRASLLSSLHTEGTNCYRLFHGATEGAPGCTLDRYGDMLLWQTFRDPPSMAADELLPLIRATVEAETGISLQAVHWNARQKRQQSRDSVVAPPVPRLLLPEDHSASEIGLEYLISVPAPGRDPASDAHTYLPHKAFCSYLLLTN